MESRMTINTLLRGAEIYVPGYQRGYSWDSDMTAHASANQVAVFLNDIMDYISSEQSTHYYLGHFIFERLDDSSYNIIDGQHRLTTAEICLSALLKRIEELNGKLTDDEFELKEDILVRKAKRHFHTVDYDDSIFAEYIIDAKPFAEDFINTLKIESQRRLLSAMLYFRNKFSGMEYEDVRSIMYAIAEADCTVHEISDSSEALEVFIFQNARGKKPTKLDILIARIMQLYSETDDKKPIFLAKLADINSAVSKLEKYRIDADSILSCAYRIWKDNLSASFSQAEFDKELSDASDKDAFIQRFADTIIKCADAITSFIRLADPGNYKAISKLCSLEAFPSVLPFIVKASSLSTDDVELLAKALETYIAAKDETMGNYSIDEIFSGSLSVDDLISHVKLMNVCKEFSSFIMDGELPFSFSFDLGSLILACQVYNKDDSEEW